MSLRGVTAWERVEPSGLALGPGGAPDDEPARRAQL